MKSKHTFTIMIGTFDFYKKSFWIKKDTHLYAGFLIKKIIVFKNNALNNLTFSKNQKNNFIYLWRNQWRQSISAVVISYLTDFLFAETAKDCKLCLPFPSGHMVHGHTQPKEREQRKDRWCSWLVYSYM